MKENLLKKEKKRNSFIERKIASNYLKKYNENLSTVSTSSNNSTFFLEQQKKEKERKQEEEEEEEKEEEEEHLSNADGIRILSFGYLLRRSCQYHKVDHIFTSEIFEINKQQSSSSSLLSSSLPSSQQQQQQLFIELKIFSKDPLNNSNVSIMNLKPQELMEFNFHKTNEVIWINILNLSILPQIVEKFGLNSLIASYFYDLRLHSVFEFFEEGNYISLCTIRIVDLFARMFKLHIFMTKNVVITFEKELLPENDVILNKENQQFDYNSSTDFTSSSINYIQEIMNPIAVDRIHQLGSFYLVYEICIQYEILSRSALELFSRAISHLPKDVNEPNPSSRHKRLTYRKILLQTTIIEGYTGIIKSQRDTILSFINNNNFTNMKMILQKYFHHLLDSLEYHIICLENQRLQITNLNNAMTQTHNLISESTSKNLNLVATMFLPLTFFAGVFGMNFQEDGGYTIEILNMKRGPDVFWALCGIVVLVNLYFFVNSGLMHLERDNRTIFGFTVLPDDEPDVETTRESLLRMKGEFEEQKQEVQEEYQEENNQDYESEKKQNQQNQINEINQEQKNENLQSTCKETIEIDSNNSN